ncbi:autotransporter domain-containing protein [Novosphingobium sp. 9U]|uniref:autotransporter domain-containing protein n=1 Tax=Novosphingobium sp. 9U TaxID=2653158 RepID=UPI00135747DD|nr:autotransporter domain-containing protein [Novosphingobium sp. 9U]
MTVNSATDLLGSVAADATGAVDLAANSNILSNTANAPALSLTSDDAINATVQSLTTSGANATAALLRAGAGVTLQALGPVTTSAGGADGINVLSASLDLTADAVQTLGADADGLELVTLDGPIALDVDLVETQGALADGAILNAVGGIDLDVGVLRTEGGQALGLNLSTDPTACAALAAGSCDINGVVGTLTTQGPGSIGALVNAAAATTLTVDVLQTNGNDAAGIDLTTTPQACLVLGAGACGTDFTVGNLLTFGDRSPGILATIVGPTNANVDLLETDGVDSPGIAIVGDPAACVLLGSGACDTGVNVGNLLTTGDGSGGLAVDVPALITADLGSVITQGDNAPGIVLNADPQACATLGVGACGVDLNATQVTTGGANSPGIGIAAVGPISLDLGSVTTNGINSPAIGIATDPTACAILGAGECTTDVTAGSITTGGDGSTGLAALVSGPVTVTTGPITTLGTDADGIALVADPTACLVAGVATCPMTVATGPVSTGGNGSTGIGLVAAGPLQLDTGNVSTLGLDAPGVVVGADPTVCAIIGSGACTTTINTGSITTNGDDSPGLGVLAGGPLTVTTGPISTLGTDAEGITLVTDPTACVLVGAVSCATTGVLGPVTTGGDGSTGIGVAAAGPVRLDTGSITTLGNNAPGLVVDTDPAACAIIGNGTCTTTVNTGSVTTGGSNSPGVGIIAGGPTTVSTGPITTAGGQSPGLTVTTDPAACLAVGAALCTAEIVTGPIQTGGTDSPGVTVGVTGPTTITTGPITTGGGNSDGVTVTIDPTLCLALGRTDCVTTVNTGPIDTGGPGSGGVVITDPGSGPGGGTGGPGGGTGGPGGGTGGDTVTVITGPITSDDDGVNVGTGCTQVNVTATGPINSRTGTGIEVASACGVTVTTLDGAPVQGATGGIDVTSGTGSVITIGDLVQAGNGLAVQVNGAATVVTNQATGEVIGRIDLTDANDVFNNAGSFRPVGNSSFGAGTDVLNNSGSIVVNPGAPAAPAAVTFTGLETLNNSGLIDMRNGRVGDSLTVPGAFVGSGASTLGVDVGATTADRLVVGGAATGSTQVLVNGLNGGFVNNAVVVDAGAGTSAGAFTLGNGGTVGIVDYSLVYNPGTNDFAVYGLPNQSAVSPLLLVDGARQITYRSSDAVAAHLDGVRTGKAFWMDAYGLVDKRRQGFATTAFGQPVGYSLDSTQDFFGVQAGVDLLGTETGTVAGITGGYASSQLNIAAGAGRARYDSFNVGLYGRAAAGPIRIEGLAKYEHVKAKYGDALIGVSDRSKADGFGGYVKVSGAFGSDRFTFSPFASLDYSDLDWKGLDLGVATADFDTAKGLRGKAGARVDTLVSDGPSKIRLYASGAYVHEFKGRDRMTLEGGGFSFAYRLPAVPDYGQAKIGVAIDQGERVSGFIEAQGDFSSSYKGGGARAGLSLRF